MEGEDKCVVQITVEFQGIPYSDCFAVEIRWVARREGDNSLRVEAGVDVDFRKTTILKGKIRSGAIEESSAIHKELLQAMVNACAAAKGDATALAVRTEEVKETVAFAPDEADTTDLTGKVSQLLSNLSLDLFDNMTVAACGALVVLVLVWRWMAVRGASSGVEGLATTSSDLVDEVALLGSRIVNLEAELKAMHGTLHEILTALKSRNE